MKSGSATKGAKKAAKLASSAKERKAAEDDKSPFSGHDKLTPHEIEAVGRYQGHEYEPINEFHRGLRTGILSDYKATSTLLDKAMTRTAFTKDVVLYRGVQPIHGVNFAALAPGHVIHDLGFHSTSMSKSVAEKFVGMATIPHSENSSALIKIKAPKGSHGLAIHKVDTGSKYNVGPHAEHEVLLPRGSSFKVTRISKRKDGNFNITVQVQ